MEKTQPMGVRFNQQLFLMLKKEGFVTSYQSALKYYESFLLAFFWTKRHYRKYDPRNLKAPQPKRKGSGRAKKFVSDNVTTITGGTVLASALTPTSLAQLIAFCPFPEGHIHRAEWIASNKKRLGL
jgi:hypothetical protein